MPPQSGNASRSAAVPPGVSRGRVPGAVRCPRLLGPRRFSWQLVLSATTRLRRTGSPGGSCSPESPSRTRELLVSAASSTSSGTRRRALRFMGAPHSRAEARTWPTLTPSGRAVARREGGVSWTKGPRGGSLPRQRTALSAAASARTGMMRPGPAQEALGDRV